MKSVPLGSQNTVEFTVSLPFSQHSPPENRVATGIGLVTVQAPTCAPEVFECTQWVQDDRYRLTVVSDWLIEPIEYEWTINGQTLPSDPFIFVDPTRVNMQVLKYTGTVNAVIPPPNGTAIPGHAIELQYLVGTQLFGMKVRGSGKTLALKARKKDLNYDIRVEVRATDALGRVFTDAANLKMIGDIAEFDRDYYDYLNRCLKATADVVNKKALWKSRLKPSEPQEQLTDMLQLVSQQLREGDHEAAAMVPALTNVFGVAAVSKALSGKASG
jgi:hypothetical protein